jgi:hypothetical protein
MAVAAADFYTYARATGTPLPKTKQEEAQLTPAVDKWKKSRTKAPERQEDSNAIRNILGTGAVAAGLAGAAAYGYRRGWGDTPGRPGDGPTPKGSPSPVTPGGNLPSDIPARLYKDDQRGVQVGKQGNLYRTQPVDIKEQPQVKTEFQNQAAADRDWDLAYIKGREDGLSDADAVLNAKRTVGQPIRKDYSPGPETEHRQHLSTLKTSSPINPRAYIENEGYVDAALAKVKGDAYADELTKQELDSLRGIDRVVKDIKEEGKIKQYDYQAGPMPPKIDPDDVVEQADGINYFNPWAADQEDIIREQAVDIASGKISGGTPYKDRDPVSGYRYEDIQNKLLSQAEAKKEIPLAPSPKQFSENQLIELNQYASSVADYDGNPDFIRINDKLDNYLEGRTNVYPLTQEDIQKFNESLTDLKKVDPGAFDDQLDQLSSDVSVSLGREAKEQTLVAQQKTIGPELTEQTLESANSGYEQMDDAFDRSVQRDTDSIAVGSQAVELEKTQKALLSQAELDKINQVGITGTRIAGPSNVQTDKPYGTRKTGNNQTLVQQGPIPEVEASEQTFLKSQVEQRLDKLQKETTELKALSENLERAGGLMAGGKGRVDRSGAVHTPGTTTFDNAMASGMVARANIQPRITSEYYRKNISLPKSVRETIDTGVEDSFRTIDTEPKGGGGRKVTGYHPDYQQLSTVGPYGIERANYPRADITKRPTEMPISPRTGKPTQSWSTRPSSSPEVAREGIKVSEDLRAIYNSGRPDAQQQADAYIEALRKRMGN